MNRRTVLAGLAVGATAGCTGRTPLGSVGTPDEYAITDLAVESNRAASEVVFDASVADATITADGPGRISFAVTNDGDWTANVHGGTEPPFGVLQPEAVDDWLPPRRRFLLWRNYEDSCVSIDDGRLRGMCDLGTTTALPSGETITKPYTLRFGTPGMRAGTYEVRETMRYGFDPRSSERRLDWTVRFSLDA